MKFIAFFFFFNLEKSDKIKKKKKTEESWEAANVKEMIYEHQNLFAEEERTKLLSEINWLDYIHKTWPNKLQNLQK